MANREELHEARQRIDELQPENRRLESQVDAEVSETLESYEDFLNLDMVQEEIETAKEETSASQKYIKGVIVAIINEGGWGGYDTIAERLGVSTTSDVSKAASELERRKIVRKDNRSDGMYVDLNTDRIEAVRQAAAKREKTEELMKEL